MSATKSDLRRAILRTAAMAHFKHDHTRRDLPCAVNDCPRVAPQGQEAAVSPIPSAAASDDLHVSHAAAMQQPGA